MDDDWYNRPPVLADENTPALDGWTGAEPQSGELMTAALDDIDPESTVSVARELSRLLDEFGLRHILHYDGPEQSLTLRLDKHGGTGLAADLLDLKRHREQPGR
ncbi:hypothetical protein ACIQU6_43170 [Streptomyces sp. NPDC090442]|uniref:hypothetical protein n=1 Tax=Streptomyces sp. NPDC090442 TaxID=3365962 RepID=UPI0037F1FAFD